MQKKNTLFLLVTKEDGRLEFRGHDLYQVKKKIYFLEGLLYVIYAKLCEMLNSFPLLVQSSFCIQNKNKNQKE